MAELNVPTYYYAYGSKFLAELKLIILLPYTITYMSLHTITQALRAAGNTEKAQHSKLFFKSGPGEYAEGDQFLGVTVPTQRKIANTHWKTVSLAETEKLLHSPIHEHRLTALFILIKHYAKAAKLGEEKAVIDIYLNNTAYVNNWDLVDSSAHKLLGPYLRYPLHVCTI